MKTMLRTSLLRMVQQVNPDLAPNMHNRQGLCSFCCILLHEESSASMAFLLYTNSINVVVTREWNADM